MLHVHCDFCFASYHWVCERCFGLTVAGFNLHPNKNLFAKLEENTSNFFSKLQVIKKYCFTN